MVTGGMVHIVLATVTTAAAATAMLQMNGFHTHSLWLQQRQKKCLKNAVAVVRWERTFKMKNKLYWKGHIISDVINIDCFTASIPYVKMQSKWHKTSHFKVNSHQVKANAKIPFDNCRLLSDLFCLFLDLLLFRSIWIWYYHMFYILIVWYGFCFCFSVVSGATSTCVLQTTLPHRTQIEGSATHSTQIRITHSML